MELKLWGYKQWKGRLSGSFLRDLSMGQIFCKLYSRKLISIFFNEFNIDV
jgi:hypothetical protein